ncbi:hypothetical protein C8A03DRAFT_18371 [Achaetomium macrosporum]|uniref:Rhodopsin domain-containing protein n=1 Tax=Achaetomium macrosporum TaxID=79813 RepID=A0AAN7C4A5_9PEZI|nr:hypothetical protein C8A03DRAFT_18371 [Achaetomium macrosporum]
MSSAEGATMGAAPPPEGATPNFENPEWIGYRLIIVSAVFPAFALCFLLPRLYSAAFIIRKWHPDDYLICVGFAFALANSIICITQSTMGMGNHIWDVSFDDFKAVMKLGMIGGAMTYNLCTLFVKLSILSFYLRFSVDKAFRIAVYVVMFIAVGYTLPNALLFAYICRPVAFYWDWSIVGGTCVNQQAVFDSANILNMSTDFLILLLPIWMLRPLRAPLLKKIGISLVLMTGGFVCGVSTMRMVTAKTGANNTDITWHYPVNLIWCLVEEYIGIVCACLPCLKAFSKRFFPTLFLFNPAFEQRVSESFPFSTFRLNTSTATNRNNNNNNDNNDDVGGRRAWWRMRRTAGASGTGSASGRLGGGRSGSAVAAVDEKKEKRQVRGRGRDNSSDRDVEAQRGRLDRVESSVSGISPGDSTKTLAEITVAEKET